MQYFYLKGRAEKTRENDVKKQILTISLVLFKKPYSRR